MSPYFNLISRDFNLKSSYFNLNSFYFNLRVKRCSYISPEMEDTTNLGKYINEICFEMEKNAKKLSCVMFR